MTTEAQAVCITAGDDDRVMVGILTIGRDSDTKLQSLVTFTKLTTDEISDGISSEIADTLAEKAGLDPFLHFFGGPDIVLLQKAVAEYTKVRAALTGVDVALHECE